MYEVLSIPHGCFKTLYLGEITQKDIIMLCV